MTTQLLIACAVFATAVGSTAIAQGVPTGAAQADSKSSTQAASAPHDRQEVSFKRDLLPLFQTNCTMCHQDALPMAGLTLLPDVAYSTLVNAGSMQVDMKRVTPGSASKSYLMHKIAGTNATVGGKGNAMPLGQPPLSKDEVDLVRRWIDQGAKNN